MASEQRRGLCLRQCPLRHLPQQAPIVDPDLHGDDLLGKEDGEFADKKPRNGSILYSPIGVEYEGPMIECDVEISEKECGKFCGIPGIWATSHTKRSKIEANLGTCAEEQRKMFEDANQKELGEWTKIAAVKRVSKVYKTDQGQLMKMGWILTWKDAGTRAKVRPVVLGETDPDLLSLRTDSPTCPRRGRLLFPLGPAELGFRLEKGISQVHFSNHETPKSSEKYMHVQYPN